MTILAPVQEESVRLARARINVWDGAVRSGKTHASLIRWLRYLAVDGPPGNVLMIGKTERTLKRNILEPIAELVGPGNARVVHGSGEAVILGRRVYLAGANDEGASSRIRGLTLAGAYGDELTLWPRSFWTMLLSRLSVPGAKVFGTTNPDSPHHWLKTEFLDRTGDLDLARFHFRLDDNPSLDPAYVDALRAEYRGLWRLRFVDGLWVAAEGAVYDAFDPTPGGPHVVAAPPPRDDWAQVSVAVDYGTANPFVALVLVRDLAGTVWVVAEWRWDSAVKQRQLTDHQYAEAVTAWLRDELGPTAAGVPWVVDPSAASFIAELRDRGVAVTGADNAVLDGIRLTASLLGDGRLRIVDRCSGLIGELAGYVWDPQAQARGTDQPLKQADHGPDALRYGVMGARYHAPPVAVESGW